VYSGVTADDEFGFSDEETTGVSLEEEVKWEEEDFCHNLEGDRVVCVTEMRKEGVVAFTESRN
jgi:hypothetical protein